MDVYNWLNDYLNDNQKKVTTAKLLLSWDKIVGDKIASISRAIRLTKNNALLVEVKEATWLTELQYHQVGVIEKYHTLFPQIKIEKIYFKLNSNLTVTNLVHPPGKTSKEKSKLEKKTISSHSKKQTTEEKLAALKEAWNEVRKVRLEKAKAEKPLASSPGLTKETSPYISTTFQKEINFFSGTKVRSFFLSCEDEFQPFDLY